MFRKNVSAVIHFCMVTTAGVADAAATVNAKRMLDQQMSTVAGNIINQGGGAYCLCMASADNNANSVGLFMTASGDVPLMITFQTTAADPTNAASFGITRLDSTVSSRMGTFGVPANFAALGLSTSGFVSNVANLQTYTANTPQSGDNFARLGAPAGVSVSADIAAIEAQTDDIGIAGAGLTALGDARLANLDATVSSRMATYTQPTGFLAATFPSDPADQSLIIAATDAIIADTNDIQATLGVAGAGLTALGAVASVTGNVGGNVNGNVMGSVQGNIGGFIATITASGGIVSADTKKVNGVTITGDGSGTPFGV